MQLLRLLEACRGQEIPLDPAMCAAQPLFRVPFGAKEAAVESHVKLQRPGERPLLEEAYASLQQDQNPEAVAAMVRSLAYTEALSLRFRRA